MSLPPHPSFEAVYRTVREFEDELKERRQRRRHRGVVLYTLCIAFLAILGTSLGIIVFSHLFSPGLVIAATGVAFTTILGLIVFAYRLVLAGPARAEARQIALRSEAPPRAHPSQSEDVPVRSPPKD